MKAVLVGGPSDGTAVTVANSTADAVFTWRPEWGRAAEPEDLIQRARYTRTDATDRDGRIVFQFTRMEP